MPQGSAFPPGGGMLPQAVSSGQALLLAPESGSQPVTPILVMPPPTPGRRCAERSASSPMRPGRHPLPAGRAVLHLGPAKPATDQTAFPSPFLVNCSYGVESLENHCNLTVKETGRGVWASLSGWFQALG